MPSLRLSFALAVVALLAACAGLSTSVNQNIGKDPDKPLPHKVLLVEPDILVHEVSAGGVVEKVDDWSKEASGLAVTAIEGVVQSQHLFELVRGPQLTSADKALLEQYTALYALVGASAYGASHSPYTAWRERAVQFDYTLGPGLTPFSEHTDVDAAVFMVGTDYISSAGRRAAMAFGILASALTGVMMMPTSMPAFMSVGVVDMRSGDLLWFSSDIRTGSANLRDPAVMRSLMEGLFATYPGAVNAAHASK